MVLAVVWRGVVGVWLYFAGGCICVWGVCMEERKEREEMGEQEDGSVHLGERVWCASMVWCG